MNIFVCVKRVPDSETKVKIASDGRSLDPAGVQYVLNPYDEIAIEQALKIKEDKGGEVTVLCLGPKESATTIRKALAMGADKGVLLVDPSGGERDTLGVAEALAEELKTREFDLCIFGRSAIDDQSAQVGPMVAQLIGMPCVTDIGTFAFEGDKVVCERAIEGGREVVETSMPALLTCQKGLAEPRLAALRGIMLAKKKPLEEKEIPAYEPGVRVAEMAYPPERKAGEIIGAGVEAVGTLITKLKDDQGII
jgi:electron transfer flavoprotein beta subunit